MPRYRSDASKVYYDFTIKLLSVLLHVRRLLGSPRYSLLFYDRYLHPLVCHAPIQHHIIALRSTNTKQQERHFNTFSNVSLATSSRRPGEIITPGMIRMQAEMKQGERNAIQEQESRLGRLLKCLPKAENSIIPHRVLLKYPYAYQAHLERISDFLLCGEGARWRHTVSGIEFIDVNTPDEDPRGAETLPLLHHFRSHTLKSESTYLQDEWNLGRKAQNIYLPRKLFFQNSKWLEKL